MSITSEQTSYTHRELAVSCFNNVWTILDNADRTKSDEETMVHLTHASFWHWTQVPEHNARNLSIGYWQLARVYAVIGEGTQALKYADKCIAVSLEADLAPFYKGYGYEAAARAYSVLNLIAEREQALAEASAYASQVADEESKSWLDQDLAAIGGQSAHT